MGSSPRGYTFCARAISRAVGPDSRWGTVGCSARGARVAGSAMRRAGRSAGSGGRGLRRASVGRRGRGSLWLLSGQRPVRGRVPSVAGRAAAALRWLSGAVGVPSAEVPLAWGPPGTAARGGGQGLRPRRASRAGRVNAECSPRSRGTAGGACAGTGQRSTGGQRVPGRGPWTPPDRRRLSVGAAAGASPAVCAREGAPAASGARPSAVERTGAGPSAARARDGRC